MEINDIITLISNLGFPIVMCILLFWRMNKQDELHKEEISNLTEVINELKLVITELKDSISKEV